MRTLNLTREKKQNLASSTGDAGVPGAQMDQQESKRTHKGKWSPGTGKILRAQRKNG